MNLPKSANSSKQGSPGISLVWVIVGGLFIVVGGYLISLLTPLLLPIAGSAEGVLIDDLFRFMLFIGGAIFLLVQGLILLSVLRFRARKGDRADGPPISGNVTLEFVWTLIPAIIVTIISIYAFVVWQEIETPHPNAQKVHAIGQRFAWTFSYDADSSTLPPGTDMSAVDADVSAALQGGEKISFSYSQLHTWVNQPVTVSMHTQDVNHAFWIPGMRLKQDLLAGRVTQVSFTPIEAGVYRIVCAELCGGGHGEMAGHVTEDGELAGAWLIVKGRLSVGDFVAFLLLVGVFYRPLEKISAVIETVIQNYPCSGCHRLDDLGWVGVTGPNLNGIGNRTARLQAGYATLSDYIHASIRHPAEYIVPGYQNIMPQFNAEADQPNYMPDADLEAIVAYLLTQTGS